MAAPLPTRSLLVAALLSTFVLSGCVTAAKTADTPAPTPAPVVAGPAPHDNLNAVLWQQTSVEYRLIAGQTWIGALAQLDRAFKTPDWDALPEGDRADASVRSLPKAVIVDVDETVLDNSIFQARLVRDQVEYTDPAWDAWVEEKAAPPVPGALPVLQQAAKRGVEVFYVTNRTQAQAAATLANLQALGFPNADADHYLGKGLAVSDCTPANGSDKTCRRRLVGRTHRVLLQVGDQQGDFVEPAGNTLAERESAMRPYQAWIGQRWFVLPNPTYGNWERAPYTRDDDTDAKRRAKKRAVLNVGTRPAE
jgi:5'-nucleotidase (lipoprotein e(P4) family)